MQKPIPVSTRAWCPGGRINAYAFVTSPDTTALVAAIAPPAAHKAISYEPVPKGLKPSPASPPTGVALSRLIRSIYSFGWTRQISSTVACIAGILFKFLLNPETSIALARRTFESALSKCSYGCAFNPAGDAPAELPVLCQP
jgi:hypothetical protein